LRPLLALVAYTRFLFSICCRTLSWRVFTTCALRLPSKLTISSIGKGIKSIGVKGLNPYTISNGENSVVECTLRLYANSINGKQFSNSLSSFEWQHAEVVLRSYCFIFLLSLFKFLHHYHISKLSSNLFFYLYFYIIHLPVFRPWSCRVIYYFDTPTLGRRHQIFSLCHHTSIRPISAFQD
jgi:hypothetical protein